MFVGNLSAVASLPSLRTCQPGWSQPECASVASVLRPCPRTNIHSLGNRPTRGWCGSGLSQWVVREWPGAPLDLFAVDEFVGKRKRSTPASSTMLHLIRVSTYAWQSPARRPQAFRELMQDRSPPRLRLGVPRGRAAQSWPRVALESFSSGFATVRPPSGRP